MDNEFRIQYKVKPKKNFSWLKLKALIIKFLHKKINRWHVNVQHKLMMDTIFFPKKYFDKDRVVASPELEKKKIQSTERVWNDEKVQDYLNKFIRVLNGTRMKPEDDTPLKIILTTLEELKYEKQIQDYHVVSEYNRAIKQKSFAIVLDFKNGKQLKFEPIHGNVDGLSHNFNMVYESGNGSTDAVLEYFYDEKKNKIRVEKM